MQRKRILSVLAVMLVCIFALSACKKQAGKPVDNAITEDTEEEKEEEDVLVFGFSAIDMENPYFITLEKAIKEVLDESEYQLITKDPASEESFRNSRFRR